MSGFGGYAPLPLRLGGGALDGLPAAQHARICADLVAVSRVAPFAWVTFRYIGDPAAPVVLAYNGMNGVGVGYKPLISVLSDSEFVVNWAASQIDSYEVAEPLAIHHAHAEMQGTVGAYATCFWQPGESSVGVFLFDSTGAASFAGRAVTVTVT